MVDTITTLQLAQGRVRLRIAFPQERVIVLRATNPSSWGPELQPSLANEICTELLLRFALDPERTTFVYERTTENTSDLLRLTFDTDTSTGRPVLRNARADWLSPEMHQEVKAILAGTTIQRKRWDPFYLRRQENNRHLLTGMAIGALLMALIMPILELELARIMERINPTPAPATNTDNKQIEAKLDWINHKLSEKLEETPETIIRPQPMQVQTVTTAAPVAVETNPLVTTTNHAPVETAATAPVPPAQDTTTEIDTPGSDAPLVITLEPQSKTTKTKP